MISENVQVEIIRACAFLVPSVLSYLAFLRSSKTEAHTKDIGIKIDGLLDKRVAAAGNLQHALGKAEGIQQERIATKNGDAV
jgi:hypothetical protein